MVSGSADGRGAASAFAPERRGSRVGAWLRSLRAAGRMEESVRRAEQAGLAFAFRARAFAIAAVTLLTLALTPWPRSGYYLAFGAAFFLSGYVPFALRRTRFAEPVKMVCTGIDAVLLTTAVLMTPPAGLGLDWPVQVRTRGQEFLYLLLLLGEAALTYSPIRVMGTGLSIATVWSAGFLLLYDLPTTRRVAEGVHRPSDADLLALILDPHFLSLTQLSTQLVATAVLTVLLTLAVLRSRLLLLAEVRSEVVRTDLARYVSPDVADALAAEAPSGFGEPATRVVTVLFADIVGFTAATESLPPERTFALLRSFQERSARIVFGHKGSIDKYLGDGLMATFGALREEEDAASRAIACAFELLEEVERWNAKRRLRHAPPMRLAVGVHCGSVVVGNLGSAQRIEFTVVGDVVNVTSRLEKLTREFACALVVSDACLCAAGTALHAGRFERSLEVQVRGRGAPLLVHVAGARGAAQG